MGTGKIIATSRDEKGWSQTGLANNSGVSRVMIGKYERGEAVPSIDAAKGITDAFEVPLDYLVGEGRNAKFDKITVKRLKDIEALKATIKDKLFILFDT